MKQIDKGEENSETVLERAPTFLPCTCLQTLLNASQRPSGNPMPTVIYPPPSLPEGLAKQLVYFPLTLPFSLCLHKNISWQGARATPHHRSLNSQGIA